jgi:hypothetical protein
MATKVFTNALVEVDGTDISPHVSELTLNYSAEILDETAMGDNTRVRKGGLKVWSFDVTMHQDFEAGAVDATMFSIVGTSSCWEIRPENACSSANNPIFSGIGLVETYNPVAGSVGALLDTNVTVQAKSTLDRNSSSS